MGKFPNKRTVSVGMLGNTKWYRTCHKQIWYISHLCINKYLMYGCTLSAKPCKTSSRTFCSSLTKPPTLLNDPKQFRSIVLSFCLKERCETCTKWRRGFWRCVKKPVRWFVALRCVKKNILLKEEILHQLACSFYHYLQGFLHARCRISSIYSMTVVQRV